MSYVLTIFPSGKLIFLKNGEKKQKNIENNCLHTVTVFPAYKIAQFKQTVPRSNKIKLNKPIF